MIVHVSTWQGWQYHIATNLGECGVLLFIRQNAAYGRLTQVINYRLRSVAITSIQTIHKDSDVCQTLHRTDVTLTCDTLHVIKLSSWMSL